MKKYRQPTINKKWVAIFYTIEMNKLCNFLCITFAYFLQYARMNKAQER